MGFDARGGKPTIQRVTADNAAAREFTARVVTKVLDVRVTGANPVRVYFSQEDADADANYLVVGAGTQERFPAETLSVWLKSDTAPSAVTLVFYERR